jgi:hypothetical protein
MRTILSLALLLLAAACTTGPSIRQDGPVCQGTSLVCNNPNVDVGHGGRGG